MIGTAALSNGAVGAAYSSALTASGGTTPYSWSISSGSLPAGLSLTADGTVTGTPTSPGQSNFTVQVADSSSPVQQSSKPLSITVESKLAIAGPISPNAVSGTAYSSTDQASGGVPGYTWSIASSSLPAQLYDRTGFLDENGNHLVVNGFNCSGTNGNEPSADDNWPAVPQIKTDLHLFVFPPKMLVFHAFSAPVSHVLGAIDSRKFSCS